MKHIHIHVHLGTLKTQHCTSTAPSLGWLDAVVHVIFYILTPQAINDRIIFFWLIPFILTLPWR